MVTGATCVGKVGRRGLHLAASAFLPRPISMRTFCRRAAQPGYAQAIWRGRHAADLTDLTTEEAAAFMADVTRVAKAVRAHFGGNLVNVQVLGNAEPHLHAHISARYLVGDVASGLPLPMEPLGELSEAELQRDADALSRLLE
jgi:diadenosine tetraphosphate (Ap4A) HIT family hydrolase